MISRSFNLLRWFSVFSLLAILLIGALSGYMLLRFLGEHLLERDAVVSMEFIQSLSRINDPEPYFRGSENPNDRNQLQEFFKHITLIPDVLRANVYSKNQTIIWSSDEEMIGKRFDDNDELADALKGHLIFEYESRDLSDPVDKIEHAYLPDDVTAFMENYIPIWDQEQQEVVGVIEMYKAPRALFMALYQGKWLVIVISLISGVVLYLLLFWIVQRGSHLIEQQQEALIEAEKLTVVGEMTASITHNLRNPLAAIRSSAELSLTEVEGSAREYLEDIVLEVDRLDQWVRKLLLVAQDEGNGVQATELSEIVNTTLSLFGQRPHKQGINIHIDLAPGLAPVRADPEALRQVLISLLANAFDAMPQGGQLKVRGAALSGAKVALEIIDTGHGISEQGMTEIFQRSGSSKPGGLGIGLPLARRILQRYGGHLTLTSRPNEGTTVNIQLPAVS